jgi:hypothetical protein
MNGPRKSLHERIAEEEKRQDELRLAIADLKARAKQLDRKLDVRRKIILGAAVQAHAKLNGRFREELRKAVLAAITRPQDMEVLPEFFPEGASALSRPGRPLKLPEVPPSGAAPS